MDHEKIIFMTSREGSFLVRSMVAAIEANNIEVKLSSIDIAELTDVDCDYICLMSENFANENTHFLGFLESYCVSNSKKLILIGSSVENSNVKNMISSPIICKEILRPIGPKPLADIISETIGAGGTDVGGAAADLMEQVKNDDCGKKHILVVDDSGLMLRTIMSWLGEKYRVSLANSAKKAFCVLEKEVPDLILLDYEMPVCNGVMFMSMLKSNAKTADIPVIFLTSRSDYGVVSKVVALNPQGYLLKSTPREQVVAKVDKFFSNK